MDYKLLCTKCEQIALKCHSYVDKSILVEKSSSAWEEVREKALYLSPLMPHAGSSFAKIFPRLYSPISSLLSPWHVCHPLQGAEGSWITRDSRVSPWHSPCWGSSASWTWAPEPVGKGGDCSFSAPTWALVWGSKRRKLAKDPSFQAKCEKGL